MGRGCTRRAFGLAGAAHIVHVFDVSSRSCLGDARTFSVYDDEYPSVGAAREDGYADGVAVMMMMGCGDHAIYVQAFFFHGTNAALLGVVLHTFLGSVHTFAKYRTTGGHTHRIRVCLCHKL